MWHLQLTCLPFLCVLVQQPITGFLKWRTAPLLKFIQQLLNYSACNNQLLWQAQYKQHYTIYNLTDQSVLSLKWPEPVLAEEPSVCLSLCHMGLTMMVMGRMCVMLSIHCVPYCLSIKVSLLPLTCRILCFLFTHTHTHTLSHTHTLTHTPYALTNNVKPQLSHFASWGEIGSTRRAVKALLADSSTLHTYVPSAPTHFAHTHLLAYLHTLLVFQEKIKIKKSYIISNIRLIRQKKNK